MPSFFAEVLVFRGVKTTFTYGVPSQFETFVGQLVNLPFGRSVVQGLVCRIYSSDQEGDFKSILSVCETGLSVNIDIVSLILWFSQMYFVTPYAAYLAVVGRRKPLKKALKSPVISSGIDRGSWELSSDQGAALAALRAVDGFEEVLLQGVTASGKTEVYLQLVADYLEKGLQAMVLIPEISLTPQTMSRFESRFPGRVGILHSGLTPVQKDRVWEALSSGFLDIVIGPRSAVFSPLPRLGVIILDEAHDLSYKQDQQPRYYTHDVARFRAKQTGSLLLYGSATPSLESYYAGITGQIKYLTMMNRVLSLPLPPVSVIDQTQAFGQDIGIIFSQSLRGEIEKTLAQGEKVMILFNRRGYAVFIQCRFCKKIHTCSECHMGLTYHQDRSYRCHRCGIRYTFTTRCNHCQKSGLTLAGLGIQKAEAELRRYFPEAKISRMDRDQASTLKKMNDLLEDFKANGDILLGTQMIAKGHDIPQVTLVAILGIDTLLNLPDYSASERAFQLLTQVAGRAGRGDREGRVIIQTLNPTHHAVTCAVTHDVAQFFKTEILFREQLHYPPFSNLIHIIFSGKLLKDVKLVANGFAEAFQTAVQSIQGVSLLGPSPAPIEMIRQHYRWQVLIKTDLTVFEEIHKILQGLSYPLLPGVRVLFDVSPKTML